MGKSAKQPRQRPAGPPQVSVDLVLLPRDGLFLKDGREWGPAGAARAHSLGWPAPSTLLGALRTACGRAQEAAGTQWSEAKWADLAKTSHLDRIVALRRRLGTTSWDYRHRAWPVPADALFLTNTNGERERIRRLHPCAGAVASTGRDNEPLGEALWWPRVTDSQKPAPPPDWWPEDTFMTWLTTLNAERPWISSNDLALPRHVQAHVGIERGTQTAEDEILFAHDVVETMDDEKCEWGIGIRWTAPHGRLAGPVMLGGDRRVARVELLPAASQYLFNLPDPQRAFQGLLNGIRLIAVTPAVFKNGWCPGEFTREGPEFRGRLPGIDADLILRAAFVPRAAHVSGWNMACNKPKETTRLVPPGAVYFLEKTNGRFTTREMAGLWMMSLGDRQSEGFGCFVPGLWNPRETR